MPTVRQRASAGGEKGNLITFSQPIQDIVTILPPKLEELPEFVKIMFVGPDTDLEEKSKRLSKFAVIRPSRVLEALKWLKQNNPYYSDIEINDENIQEMDEKLDRNGIPFSILQSSINVDDIKAAEAETGGDHGIQHANKSGDPIMQTSGLIDANGDGASETERAHAAVQSFFKDILVCSHNGPVSEIKNEKYWACSFPTLFPYGIGGYYDETRDGKKFSLEAWGKHLISLHDRRFQEHPSWQFILQNQIQKKAVCWNTKLNVSDLTLDQIKAITAEQVSWLTRLTISIFLCSVRRRLRFGLAEVIQISVNWRQKSELLSGLFRKLELTLEIQKQNAILTCPKGSQCSRCLEPHIYLLRSTLMTIGKKSIFLQCSYLFVARSPLLLTFAGKTIPLSLNDPDYPELPEYFDRASLVSKNPTAAAKFFHRTVFSFIHFLLGWDPELLKIPVSKRLGIFGDVKAFMGTVESQNRGTLHFHSIIWLQFVPNPAELFAKLEHPAFQKRFFGWLERTIRFDMPTKEALQAELFAEVDSQNQEMKLEQPEEIDWKAEKKTEKQQSDTQMRDAQSEIPDPNWFEKTEALQALLNMTKEELKGMSFTEDEIKSIQQQVEDVEKELNTVQAKARKYLEERMPDPGEDKKQFAEFKRAMIDQLPHMIPRCNLHKCNPNCYKGGRKTCRYRMPQKIYTRTSIQEGILRLKTLHQYIGSWNKWLTFALRSNTNLKWICSGKDGAGSMIYILKYVTKSGTRIHHKLALLETCLRKTDAEVSGDSKTVADLRVRSRKLVIKCVNRVGTHSELTGPEVASSLLGYKNMMASHSFANMNIHLFLKDLEHHNESKSLDAAAQQSQRPAYYDLAPAKEGATMSNALINYEMRHRSLRALSPWEFFAHYKKKPVSKKKKKKKTTSQKQKQDGKDEKKNDEDVEMNENIPADFIPQDSKNGNWLCFEPDHPQYRTHMLFKREHSVVAMIGRSIPSVKDDKPGQQELRAKLLIAAFYPRTTSKGIRKEGESWQECFKRLEPELPAIAKDVMANTEAQHEGKHHVEQERLAREGDDVNPRRRNEIDRLLGDEGFEEADDIAYDEEDMASVNILGELDNPGGADDFTAKGYSVALAGGIFPLHIQNSQKPEQSDNKQQTRWVSTPDDTRISDLATWQKAIGDQEHAVSNI